MEKKASICLVVAIIFGILAAYTWATIPPNFSGITLQPKLQVQDQKGNIQTLTINQLSTMTYPNIQKFRFYTRATIALEGIDSTQIRWSQDYRVRLNKPGGVWAAQPYDNWEPGFDEDDGTPYWAPYGVSTWTPIKNGETCDLATFKKAVGGKEIYPEAWIPLDPNDPQSIGGFIKSSNGFGKLESGVEYTVIFDTHVKVNYLDNFGDEKTAIGPPKLGGANGEFSPWFTFTVSYTAGSATITIQPIFANTWIPLDMLGNLSPLAINFATFFVTMGLPTWTAHILFPGLTVAFGALTYYYYEKED